MIIMTTAMWWIWVVGIAAVSLGMPEEEQEKLAAGTYGCAMPPWIADAALSVGIVAWPVMLLTHRVFSLAVNK
jgi:hypothetical protein